MSVADVNYDAGIGSSFVRYMADQDHALGRADSWGQAKSFQY